ncbi:MAG: ribonuclease P protein component [Spirochaetes bacterium]|nr:ribonuclease P protein component [Spirochaetota bacterium]
MSHSFSHWQRLRKRKEFDQVFANGKFIRSQLYHCCYTKNHSNTSRIGIIVKKKDRNIIRNAVTRNYEKRVVKEIFRTHSDRLPQVDMIIIVKTFSSSFSKKKDHLLAIFDQIKNESTK